MKTDLNTIKKHHLIYIISSIIAVFIALILNFFDLGYPLIFLFIILPFTYGILFILIQDKNRSYQFIPRMILWSFTASLLVLLFFQIFSLYFFSIHNLREILEITLILFLISLAGGLVGLVIRGITLLAQNK